MLPSKRGFWNFRAIWSLRQEHQPYIKKETKQRSKKPRGRKCRRKNEENQQHTGLENRGEQRPWRRKVEKNATVRHALGNSAKVRNAGGGGGNIFGGGGSLYKKPTVRGGYLRLIFWWHLMKGSGRKEGRPTMTNFVKGWVTNQETMGRPWDVRQGVNRSRKIFLYRLHEDGGGTTARVQLEVKWENLGGKKVVLVVGVTFSIH